MAEKVDIYMKLYIGDYLADTTELSAEEHGAYLLLMFTAWRRGGRLPTDQEQLRRAARVSERRWQKVWGMIARFFTLDGDALVQTRLNQELAKAQATRASASASGRASAEARKRQRTGEQGINERSTDAGTNAVTDGPTKPQATGNSSESKSGSLSISGSDSADLGADQARPRSNGHADLGPFHQPRRIAPVGLVTAPFIEVFDRYPRKDGKLAAAQVWHELAADYPGGEIGLRAAILKAFDAGMLRRAPYAGENRTRPMLDKVLAERRFEDPVSAPDDRPAASVAAGPSYQKL